MSAASGTRGPAGDVVVVGGGVIGLSVAVLVAEAGRSVTVVADRLPLETTSRVAGAVWQPYLSDGPDVLRWAAVTYRALTALAGAGVPGVTVATLRSPGEVTAAPPWTAVVDGLRALPVGQRPSGWDDGFACRVPLVDMGAYLPYLQRRLEAAAGAVVRRSVDALAELAPAAVVVNCAGLGARQLVGDTALRAVRGQLVVVRNPGVTGAVVDDRAPLASYVIAHGGEVVLGGTSDHGEEDLTVDPATAADIVARAAHLDGRLAGAEVVGHRVGLRPWRPTVRLEEDVAPAGVGRLVHCYGHGGSGVTLSWGCAADVATLLGAPGAAPPATAPPATAPPASARPVAAPDAGGQRETADPVVP